MTSILGRLGWWTLVVVTALMLANHLAGVFAFAEGDDEQLMFVMFALLNLYALIVLLLPFRRREPWAWWLTWTSIAAFAISYFFITDPSIGLLYLVIGGVLAFGQVLTYREIVRRDLVTMS